VWVKPIHQCCPAVGDNCSTIWAAQSRFALRREPAATFSAPPNSAGLRASPRFGPFRPPNVGFRSAENQQLFSTFHQPQPGLRASPRFEARLGTRSLRFPRGRRCSPHPLAWRRWLHSRTVSRPCLMPCPAYAAKQLGTAALRSRSSRQPLVRPFPSAQSILHLPHRQMGQSVPVPFFRHRKFFLRNLRARGLGSASRPEATTRKTGSPPGTGPTGLQQVTVQISQFG
jgi:hypothetical protein